jgi:gluconolactonase
MGCLALATIVAANEEPFANATKTVFDEHFYEFVAADSRVEILAPVSGQDIGWAEGPLWVADLNSLLFSDVANDTIYRWDEATGLTIYLYPSGHPADDAGHAWRGSNGLGVDHHGNLILAQQSNRTLSRMRTSLQNPAPDYEVLVERYRGQKLNSPNDLVVNAAGDIYFTDPPYGLSGFENSPDIELGFFGVFRLSRQGQMSIISKTLEKPNGLALSADQRTLYVSNSDDAAPQKVERGRYPSWCAP